MFDDPKKELRELEDQLLAAESNNETAELNNEQFEELYDEILEEFGPKEESFTAPLSPSDPPIRNFANGYGGVVRTPPLPAGDEILPDDEPVPTEKGGRGLIFLAVVESLAIAGLVMYWVLNAL